VPPGDGKVKSTKHTKLTSSRAVPTAGVPAAFSSSSRVGCLALERKQLGFLSLKRIMNKKEAVGFVARAHVFPVPRLRRGDVSPDAWLIFGLRFFPTPWQYPSHHINKHSTYLDNINIYLVAVRCNPEKEVRQ
jgi:hypothetical protein